MVTVIIQKLVNVVGIRNMSLERGKCYEKLCNIECRTWLQILDIHLNDKEVTCSNIDLAIRTNAENIQYLTLLWLESENSSAAAIKHFWPNLTHKINYVRRYDTS